MEEGFIEMTVPDRPDSSLQKYRLATVGERIKKNLAKSNSPKNL